MGAQNGFDIEKDFDAWVEESLDAETVGVKFQTYGDNNK